MTNTVQQITPEKISGLISQWQWLIVPLAGLLTALVKKYATQIPTKWLVLVAPLFGAILDTVATKVGLWESSGLLTTVGTGAVLGALATWVHQVGRQTGLTQSSDQNVCQSGPPTIGPKLS